VFNHFLFSGKKYYIEFLPNQYVTELEVIHAVGRLVVQDESSNAAGGLGLVRKILTTSDEIRLNIPQTILVIAAGSPDDSKLLIAEADRIKAQGIRIVTVGVGAKVSCSRFWNTIKRIAHHFFYLADCRTEYIDIYRTFIDCQLDRSQESYNICLE